MSDMQQAIGIVIKADGTVELANGMKLSAEQIRAVGQQLDVVADKLDGAEKAQHQAAEAAGGMAGKMVGAGEAAVQAGRDLAQGDFIGAAKNVASAATAANSMSGALLLGLGAVGGMAVAIGSLAYAAMQGASEQRALNDSLILTGRPRTVFALSVQVPRHGPKLQRRVVDNEKLHNIDVWKELGPVYAPTAFSRMLNVWERAAGIGARDAINFVGLAWRDGKPVVNEGPDCFFADPRQQCPYSDLVFPSSTLEDGRTVMEQFQGTFDDNAAMIPLVWALGAHLKAFMGFWPHFVMQAEKGPVKPAVARMHTAGQVPPPRPTRWGWGLGRATCSARPGGGGYLNECNRSDVSKRDLEVAKIRELEDMGLPNIWLRVARAIGFENFMQFWRIVDTAAEHREMRLSDNESMIEVQMRRYASFKRYQRNRFIETLAAGGHSATEIQQAVKGQLGESLSRNHIVRLARRGRMTAK